MEKIEFEITGAAPLLMHSPAGMRPRATGPQTKTIPTPEEEAEAAVDRLPSGEIYVRTVGFRMGVLYASTGRKIGKRGASSVVSAGLFATHMEAPLYDPETKEPIKDYALDIRRAVIQRQGILRARARFNRWACKVEFEYDPDFLQPEWIQELLTLAGKISGMGDFRVQKKGEFGRYIVQCINGGATSRAAAAKPKHEKRLPEGVSLVRDKSPAPEKVKGSRKTRQHGGTQI